MWTQTRATYVSSGIKGQKDSVLTPYIACVYVANSQYNSTLNVLGVNELEKIGSVESCSLFFLLLVCLD